MKLFVYSVFDSKGAIYNAPFFLVNDQTAIRAFSRLVADAATMISHAPEDFTLNRIGEFDDNTGVLSSCRPEPLANGASLRAAFVQAQSSASAVVS